MQRFDLAFVVHRTPTRMRIRIPSRRGEDAFFDGLKRQLLGRAGVWDVQTSSVTCSVVIKHSQDCEWSSRKLAEFGLICATKPCAPGSSHTPLAAGPRQRESKVVDAASVIADTGAHTGSAFLSSQLGAALTRYAAERLVSCALAYFLTTTPKQS